MAARMISARDKETGQEIQIGESAFPYFAASLERLDEPAEQQPPTVTPDKSARRRPATTEDKE